MPNRDCQYQPHCATWERNRDACPQNPAACPVANEYRLFEKELERRHAEYAKLCEGDVFRDLEAER
jgi:hypothetical protein